MRVLVIDDDRAVHRATKRLLARTVEEVISTADPVEGIQLASQTTPDLILLDINMPTMDGLKVCRHLRDLSATRDIPVLFLTIDRDVRHLEKALDCGGTDYILKPFNELELLARVRAALRTKRMIDLLKVQARIDALTGLKNRASLDDALEAATSAHSRMGQPITLLMIDIDHFKRINDSYGHGIGDEVLRQVGSAIRVACRPYDTACRFGGDEFAVVFSDTQGFDAEQAAARMLAGICGIVVDAGSDAVQVTLSAGMASSEDIEGPVTADAILKSADAALYRAKHEGRNRLVVHGRTPRNA